MPLRDVHRVSGGDRAERRKYPLQHDTRGERLGTRQRYDAQQVLVVVVHDWSEALSEAPGSTGCGSVAAPFEQFVERVYRLPWKSPSAHGAQLAGSNGDVLPFVVKTAQHGSLLGGRRTNA